MADVKSEIAEMASENMDSLEFIELVQKVEERYGVRVPIQDMESVGDLARFVEAQR